MYTKLLFAKSNFDRNSQLLDYILEYSKEKLDDFIRILKLDQPDIVSLFTGKHTSNIFKYLFDFNKRNIQ